MLPAAFRFFLAASVLVLLSSCAPAGRAQQDSSAQQNSSEGAGAFNQLTAEERAEGWRLLFDGGDLSQWRGFRQEAVPAGWSVEDGAIYFDPSAEGGGDLLTESEYGDFELKLDWKISQAGNSGIIYRVSEDREASWRTGPEYQVLDNERHPDAENGRDRTAAAAYGLYAPSEDLTKPVGQWNQARILVNDGHVEHWLNGEKVVEYELGSDDWKQRVAESKFSSMPGYGQNERGHIALQDHGNEVWYRNIKIRPLGDS